MPDSKSMTSAARDATAPHAHPEFLAHHFDTPEQQSESAALGMWLFLATEILLFGGLFCAYAVYRANHPEIFEYAHQFLSKTLGAVNTVILLASSFTMAAGVWAIQRGRARLSAMLMALTLLGGLGFLGIKFVEYEHKWKEGLLWGKHYRPHDAADSMAEHAADEHAHRPAHPDDPGAVHHGAGTAHTHPAPALPRQVTSAPVAPRAGVDRPTTPTGGPAGTPPPAAATAPTTQAVDPAAAFRPADLGPRGLQPADRPAAAPHGEAVVRNVHTFFGIYFAMTGLHALHVIAGLAVIGWVMLRTLGGQFSATYHTPVHMVGLYWHVVDLVWIYLFPLLYLIH